MSHDDGQNVADLDKADVIIMGISRTSKTPTSIYLAQRGIRAANIPVILGIPVPPQVFELKNKLIVGLIASADRIAQIRRNRLLSLHEGRTTDYADPRHITQEMVLIKSLCTENNWPMIDVTRRSVEETAASIMNLIANAESEAATSK
jgi:regulator of PEP synthase PpsR (kinase-PPPase family)